MKSKETKKNQTLFKVEYSGKELQMNISGTIPDILSVLEQLIFSLMIDTSSTLGSSIEKTKGLFHLVVDNASKKAKQETGETEKTNFIKDFFQRWTR